MNMHKKQQTVLVLGANGRLGQAAVKAFAVAGWRVLAQTRRTPLGRVSGQAFPSGVEEVYADLLNPGPAAHGALLLAAHGATAVVYAANPAYTDWHEDAYPMACQGMDIAAKLGARLLFPGNVYNFGADMPPVLLPDTAQRPSSAKGRIRCHIELELQERSRLGLKVTVLRCGDFFGSGSGSWFDLVIAKDIAKQTLTYPGPLDLVHAWAYLPDVAQSMVQLASTADSAAFRIRHFAGYSLSGRELIDALTEAGRAVGCLTRDPVKIKGVPWGIMRVGGWFVPLWRELAEIAYLWQVPHRLDQGALQQLPVSVAVTPLPQALARALRELVPLRQAAIVAGVQPAKAA